MSSTTTFTRLRARLVDLAEHVIGLLINRCAICMSATPDPNEGAVITHGACFVEVGVLEIKANVDHHFEGLHVRVSDGPGCLIFRISEDGEEEGDGLMMIGLFWYEDVGLPAIQAVVIGER